MHNIETVNTNLKGKKIIITLWENVYRDPMGCWRAVTFLKKSSQGRFFVLYWSTVAIRTLWRKKGHWVASADIQKENGLSKKPLIMSSPAAGSGTSHTVSRHSCIFSPSPTLLCFPLCWLHSQARHSSHCVGKVVITNSRLNSIRLVASRKESAFFPTISGKSLEWHQLAWLGRCSSLNQLPVSCALLHHAGIAGPTQNWETGSASQETKL